MNKQLKGFMDFVRAHGVVGLAVGLAIGLQAAKTVEAIVHGFINPIVSFIVGDTQGLDAAKWELIKSASGGRTLTIYWGEIVSALITLLAVSLVIYYVVQGLKLDRIDKTDKK